MPLKLKDSSLLKSEAFIGGAWRAATSGETFEVTNPATGETLISVPKMGADETREAIDAAAKAFPEWAALLAEKRSAILRQWFDLLMENQADLAALMTAEQGKSLTESKGEIAYAASFIEWFSQEARRTYGDIIPSHTPTARILVTHEPVGVTAAITPWNFPAAMIARKAAAALSVGCTMVVKPASATPLTALAMAVLAERAGIPAGVLSVITGSAGDIGGELTSNPKVRKVSFTGSTETGKKLMQQSASTLKRLSLELGGNAPFLVFDDADLDAAVEGAIASKFRNSGQTCVCANRFLVQDSIYDAFAEKLQKAVSKLKVGNGMDEGVDQGPLINDDAVETVKAHIEDAVTKGARIALGGKPHALGGTFFEPTILLDVPKTARLAREETFGPVAALFRFTDEAEAIAMANDTEFGLAAYAYTKDLARAFRVSAALDYGIVGMNEGLISTAIAPFGGRKESGFGREGSKYGVSDYLDIKYTLMGGLG
ncbi:succinate-semialdehyde dehydrogenase [Hyphomonas neptunium ATCC 15444]|uniref:Succinate-semialdehyde dehydrogenase n=1 Tax=Hyphomonas neptunium (strain ATCC 15444) TaxID=228405 RepID=Q0BZS3_HYPNA|nr:MULTISPECIES: NAD-dependent succinate-semialdehyde dehydrogenase [Hyphomonas]ABI77488.1 succinate-semialdehyde dehydrogenase [Hyphomonas neptunium ATCC 15444]